MIKKYLLLEKFILFYFNNFSFVKTDYVSFDLKTYKNNSNYSEEYEKFFYDNLYNILYSEIPLGPNKEKYIMEIKVTSYFFTIYNHNCEVPPVGKTKNTSYSQNFADSNLISPILMPFYGEYFTSVLENTIYLETNKGKKNVKISYIYSPRNDSQYTRNLILRPYTCFTLGFEIFLKQNEDIDSIDDYALNLVMQFKRANITSSYNWFIEYDSKNNEKAKLIIGEAPYKYNSKKYKEENSKQFNADKRIDGYLYWDIKMSEIYLKNGTELYKDLYMNLYLSCNLEPSLGVIMGTSGYKDYIEYNFFKPLRDEGKCFRSSLILNTYTVYYCNKDIKEELESNFSAIIFMQRTLNKSFELTFDDLFVEKADYLFFLVFFNRYDQEIWKFGKPFLKKYFFSYDLDGRTITFYEKAGKNNKNNKNNTVLIIVIVFLILIFAIVGFFLAKYIYSYKKRKSATELKNNDDYNYDNLDINNE